MNHKKPSMIVPPETFKTFSDSAKLDTIYHYIHAMFENQETQAEEIDKLQKRKLFDKGLSVSAGGAGGFAAMLVKWVVAKLLT